jgi:hypothetical protein
MWLNNPEEKEYLVLTFHELEKIKVFIREDDHLEDFLKNKKVIPINCTGAFVVKIKNDEITYNCLKNSPFDKAAWTMLEINYFHKMQRIVEKTIFKKTIWSYLKRLFHFFLKKK